METTIRPLEQVTLASKITQLTQHTLSVLTKQLLATLPMLWAYTSPPGRRKAQQGRKVFSPFDELHFSPGVKRTVKASSPPNDSSACWTRSLPQCSEEFTQDGTSLSEGEQQIPRKQPLSSPLNSSSNSTRPACLCVAHAWPSFYFASRCERSRTSKTQLTIPLLVYDLVISSVSMKRTFLPLWLLNGSATPLASTVLPPRNVTFDVFHVVTSVALAHQDILPEALSILPLQLP